MLIFLVKKMYNEAVRGVSFKNTRKNDKWNLRLSSLTSPNRYLIDLLDHEQFFLFQYCKFYSYLAFRFAIVSKSSPVQSNTRVWYVVALITVNKSPILFCMPYSWRLFGLINRNLTIRRRRRPWKRCWKRDFASFQTFSRLSYNSPCYLKEGDFSWSWREGSLPRRRF